MQKITIRRNQLIAAVVIGSFLLVSVTACGPSGPQNGDIQGETSVVPADDATADKPVDALYFQNAQQCKDALGTQKQEFERQQADFAAGKIAKAPDPLPMQPEDCDAQFDAAQQDFDSHATEYTSKDLCTAEGTECQVALDEYGATATDDWGNTLYRPSFGGFYVYPYDSPLYVNYYYGGSYHRILQPSTVYLGRTPGTVVTSYGRTVTQAKTGARVSVPRHTSYTAVARPSAPASSGVLSGRGKAGFGSTFKATGRGGIGK